MPLSGADTFAALHPLGRTRLRPSLIGQVVRDRKGASKKTRKGSFPPPRGVLTLKVPAKG